MKPHINAKIVQAEYISLVSLKESGKNALINMSAEINATKEAK